MDASLPQARSFDGPRRLSCALRYHLKRRPIAGISRLNVSRPAVKWTPGSLGNSEVCSRTHLGPPTVHKVRVRGARRDVRRHGSDAVTLVARKRHVTRTCSITDQQCGDEWTAWTRSPAFTRCDGPPSKHGDSTLHLRISCGFLFILFIQWSTQMNVCMHRSCKSTVCACVCVQSFIKPTRIN